ncbi:MAG: HmuY family protein [Thermonemataceae bacterium]
MNKLFFRGLVWLMVVGLFTACNEDDDDPTPMPDPDTDPIAVELEVRTVTDLPADPFTGEDDMGRPVGKNQFTFYSLENQTIVAREDSASSNWDIAFQGTNIIINGGPDRFGEGGAYIFEGTFEELQSVDPTRFIVDGVDNDVNDSDLAIPTGSTNGWYNYNPAIQVATPIPGRILVIRTASGKYAKIEILSYYKGAPESPTNEDESRYYTFRYVYQPEGTNF